ncbi:MAG: hydantoinase B/oxoprolinase family protein, partial [Deltaproteobacteria bacterium]|nr:hydantoinase B/oxoprolinase family protein [Deltaproteobacteria bacterium]
STVHNVEWVEANFPLMYLYRRHLQDGAGAGKFRGGAGEESLIMPHDAPEANIQIVALGVAGLRNSGFGIYGGHPGAPSILVHVEDSDVRQAVAAKTLPDELEEAGGSHNLLGYRDLRLSADDLLYLRCANGGGYGDPLEREPDSVAEDVVDGLVSREAAESIYGVVFAGTDGVDGAGTREKRESLKRERQAAVTRATAVAEPPGTGTGAVRHPLQESLVLCDLGERTWVQCARCDHILCESDIDWREACSLGAAPPTEAGPLMDLLLDQYEFQRWYCPGCGVLLDSEIAAAGAQPG